MGAKDNTNETLNPVRTSIGIGMMPEYKSRDDWNLYVEKLDKFFIANLIENDRKVSVLITMIGADTCHILKELCDPVLPNTLGYEHLCSLLSKQFSSKIAIFRQPTKFYELKQNNCESINEWYVRIKKVLCIAISQIS